MGVPALLLSGIHTVLIGSHYLGELEWTWENQLRALIVGGMILLVLLARSRLFCHFYY